MTTPTDSAPTSWAGRYGQVLLAAGVAPIPTALFTQQAALDLAAAEVWFVARVLAGA